MYRKQAIKNALIALVLNFFYFAQTFAQTGYSVKRYTAENGLPQNSIKSIGADSFGFIWLATEDGLARFDGRRFSVYNSNNLDVKSNRVFSIRLSVKMPGIRVKGDQSPGSDRAQVLYARFGSEQVVRIEDGRIALDSLFYEKRLSQLRSLEVGATRSRDFTAVVGLPDLLYTGAFGNDHHVIMAGGDEGNFFMVDHSKVRYYENWKKKYECKSPGPELWKYFVIEKRLYYQHDIDSYSQISGTTTTNFQLGGALGNIGDSNKSLGQKLYWNGISEQTFIFYDNGLYVLEQQSDGKLSSKLLIENYNLLNLGIDVIYYDTVSDRIFLGSAVNGLYILAKEQFRVLTVQGESLQNVFYAQLPYFANAILTPTGQLLGVDPRSNQVVAKSIPEIQKANPLEKRVIIKGPDDAVWIKGWNELFRYDSKASRVTKEWIADSDIKALCSSKPDHLWIGTETTGVYKLDLSSFPRRPVQLTGAGLGTITYLEARDQSQLLVGTEDGLFLVDMSSGKSRLVTGTKGTHIKSIHPFGNRQAWITGQGRGIMLLNERDDLIAFPLDRNKYMASPHCAFDDGNGFIWISTNKGLFQIQKLDLFQYVRGVANVPQNEDGKYRAQLFYLFHAMEEGFASNEFNGACQPCGVKLSNGNVSLPSLKGLVWFEPKTFKPDLPNGKIIFDRVLVDNKQMKIDGEQVTIPENAEGIKLFLSTAYWGHINNLQLSYAVLKQGEPINSAEWVAIEDENLEIQLSALRSGKYLLLVKKPNGFGYQNQTVTRLVVVFPEKWHENIWMISILMLSLIAMAAIITNYYNEYRLRMMITKNLELEMSVAARTEKLSQAVMDLEVSREDLDKQVFLLTRLMASISHDVQSPLRFIVFASNRIPEMVKPFELDEVSRLGSMIAKVSEQMAMMLEQSLSFIKIQLLGSGMQSETVDIYQIVQEKSILFAGKIEANGIDFENRTLVGQTVEADYQMLSIIIHNLLDNATKYTFGGKIWVSFRLIDELSPEVTIANSGNIPEEIVDMINSEGGNRNFSELIKSGKITGVGLFIVKEVAAIANISVTVSQTADTYFHLRFPSTGSRS